MELVMASPYCCVCFAIPSRLLRKIAERSDEEDSRILRSTVDSAALLRSRRTAQAKRKEAQPATEEPSEVLSYKRSIFDAENGMELPGRVVREEGGAPVGDDAADHAYDNTGITLDFFSQVFSRNSIDDRGARVESAVHFGERFGNAMWIGDRMVYGDGNQQVRGFTESIEIIAHKLTHGVLQHLVSGGLGAVRIPVKDREFKGQTHALKGQSGALNESFADIFGSLVKQWHLKQDTERADWLMGDDLLAPEFGKSIRSLKDPGNRNLTWFEDDQFKSMDQYFEGAQVHDSSGIPNRAFYLAANEIGGFAWDQAGLIWYDAFSRLKPRAKFADAAKATLNVAKKKFGGSSKEFKAVRAAWREVKVID